MLYELPPATQEPVESDPSVVHRNKVSISAEKLSTHSGCSFWPFRFEPQKQHCFFVVFLRLSGDSERIRYDATCGGVPLLSSLLLTKQTKKIVNQDRPEG